jgi:hypothetical protein
LRCDARQLGIPAASTKEVVSVNTFENWDHNESVQRAVWVQPGAAVISGGQKEPIDVVLVESGVAVLGDYFWMSDNFSEWDLRIPIFKLPPASFVIRAVAACWNSSIHWEDDADAASWSVKNVRSEIDLNSDEFVVLPRLVLQGEVTNISRVGYHVTSFLRGERGFSDEILAELART